jgi:hypothetical protein
MKNIEIEIKRMLRENLNSDDTQSEATPVEDENVFTEKVSPKSKQNDSEGKSEKKDSEDLKAKHKRVEALLSNNVFNHAGVIEKLWGDSEASNRSLFRKKLHRELNDNGVPYEFDDKELSKILNIMMGASAAITKSIKK